MILGYLDANDRIYDLGFATLKMTMSVEPAGGSARILFSKAAGEGRVAYRVLAEADVSVSLAMDHGDHKIPLLRPVEGHLYRHEAGLLFVAAPPKREPEEPGFFLVKVQAMSSALRFFFEDQKGTELISVPQNEVLRIAKDDRNATVYVTAESVQLPGEKIAYALEIAPPDRVMSLLAGLVVSR
jgi:hypothetical protein